MRRLELWSVAKVALFFHLLCYALTVGVLIGLWWVAYRFGLVTKLETFLSDYGFSDKATRKDFQLKGGPLLRGVLIGGIVLVGVNTVITVVLAFFYNGVSGLFGGLVVSVLEERPAAIEQSTSVIADPSHATAPPPAVRMTARARRRRRRARKRAAVARARAGGVAPDGARKGASAQSVAAGAPVVSDMSPSREESIDLVGSWLDQSTVDEPSWAGVGDGSER